MRSVRRCGSGFTLVELLVVIGIIALLIGLLMPTLARARQQGNWIRCQSNMRQVGVALQTYLNDADGWMFPPLRGSGNAEDQRWTAFVFDKWNPAIMLCPSDLDPVEEHSYILNSHLWEKKVKWTSHDLGGRSSSEIVVMGEKQTSVPDYYVDAGEDFDQLVELFRHGVGKGSNYLYMDWHVDTLRTKQEIVQGMDPWDIVVATPPAGTH
jgi:prepilin-type N-terminal cleavage/methylation domain-containing protein/prepilin-type processing-associated H-X9-DG protein